MARLTSVPTPTRRVRSSVLDARDVQDDDAIHTGVVVWLSGQRLDARERQHFDDAARTAAMRRHPSTRPPRLGLA